MIVLFILAPLLLPFYIANAVPSNGCGKKPSVELGHSTDLTITSDSGVSPRKYRIHVPETYDMNVDVPLILSFHARGKNTTYQEHLSQFSNASYGFQGITIYPEGIPINGDTYQWQGDPDAPESIDDIKFTMELLDELFDNYCINTARVYAAGKSNGGGFTSLLACDPVATKKIAAFAPVSGAIYLNPDTEELPPCKPSSKREVIPIMEFHGWKDEVIYYVGDNNTRDNGVTVPIIDWVKDWAARDGFDPDAPEITYLCSGVRNVTKYSWQDTVVHYNVSNYGHAWPSTFANEDTSRTTCKEAEATSEILKWFAKWSLL
ncbi:alpha/beta-hydrolase [Lojkania enalia]|uniref:feruloyl esterase n=1 Tax=Lojkania enalia TaxID=147567 RepID=A0A9P4K8T0_9PLEO|nr:alpha/beta-hydrolase [Didymosphaeria enalia]